MAVPINWRVARILSYRLRCGNERAQGSSTRKRCQKPSPRQASRVSETRNSISGYIF